VAVHTRLLEQEGKVLTPEWGAADLIGLGEQLLEVEGDGRERSLLSFGWRMRDWQFRRLHGSRVRNRLKAQRGLKADPEGARARRNAKRRSDSQDWQEHACAVAAPLWQRKPSRSASDLAKDVERQLEKAGGNVG
jgi:hypothetical protein